MISLEQALRERVLLLNTSPMNPAWRHLPDSTWGGPQFLGSPSRNVTRPDLVLEWYTELSNAGTDVLETFSAGADPFTAGEYGADRTMRSEWNRAAVEVARRVTDGRKYLIGAVGQSLDLLTIRPRHSYEEHVSAFAEQIRDLWAAKVDAIHLQFCLDSQNLKAALNAVAVVQDECGSRIPTMITFDLDVRGMIWSGERPEDLWGMLRDYKPIALALATYGYGQDTVRRLREVTDVPIGLLLDPCYNEPVEWLAKCLCPLLDEHLLSFCGLSCTVPSIKYVKEIAQLIR